tara:strand:+ start:6676 stop:7236 length:561 start_codon:yes stop_codon:yes gene_type:complete
MATYLHQFRQYDENEVLNLFTYDGTTVDAGRLVTLDTAKVFLGVGEEDHVDLGSNTGASYGNVVSTSFDVKAKFDLAAAGASPVGMTLMAMKETDENGEKLLYNPRKAAEMGVVIPGQAVPLLTRGVVLFKGDHAGWTGATINAGDSLYCQANGELDPSSANSAVRVGQAIGKKDSNHWCLVKLEL